LTKEKTNALKVLKDLDISTQMIFVATRGVNEDQIGEAVDLFLSYRFIDFKKHGGMLRSSATLGASPEMQVALQDVIHDVFANQAKKSHCR